MRPPYSIAPSGAIIFKTIPHKDNAAQHYAHHSLFYKRNTNEIIHANVWHGMTGRINNHAGWVQLQPLFEGCETEEGGAFTNTDALYCAVVAHAKIPALQSALDTLSSSRSLCNIPFTYYTERRKDKALNPDHLKQLELFRAFRNAERILTDRPISQNKGVSCGNFVSYIIKAAIITTLFPEGLSKRLSDAVYKIEQIRKASSKKLDQVDIEHLQAFEQTFKKEIQKLSLDKLHQLMVNELYQPVKHVKVDLLHQRMLSQPELWNVQVLVQVNRPWLGPVAGISFEQASHLEEKTLCQTEGALRKASELLEKQTTPNFRPGRL